MSPALERVLKEIAAERARQDVKFGPTSQDKLQNGTAGSVDPMFCNSHAAMAQLLKDRCDRRMSAGTVTFADILLEEVFEALAESDPEKLREELVQVAAVCAKWIEKLDRVDLHSADVVEARRLLGIQR